jgi:predicted membrane protein
MIMGNRALFGVLLVLIGIAIILNSYFNIFTGFSSWWPLILILIGIVHLVKRSASLLTSLMVIAIGLVFLGGNIGWIPGRVVFPILLIIVGCWLIFSRIIGSQRNVSEDHINHFVLFSGLQTQNHTQNFTGGSVAAIFGGAEIDLRDAQLSEQGGTLELTAVFGGVDISVPKHWNVVVSGTPFFGGWENKTRYVSVNNTDNGPVLKVNCLTIFGGAEIKN